MQQRKSVLAKNFAAALLKARGDKSQAEFSRFLGLKHQQTYQAYEAGRVPDGETLFQIASKLGLSFDELLLGERKEEPDDKQLMIVVGMLVTELGWQQLLRVASKAGDNQRLSKSNQEIWMRMLAQWALHKMPTKEQVDELVALLPEEMGKEFESRAKSQ
jgi:transcriptional regulator with XRE-family HTH domain